MFAIDKTIRDFIIITLTVLVTTWLLKGDEKEQPTKRGNVTVFPRKRRIRLAGIVIALLFGAGGVFFAARDRNVVELWWIYAILGLFVLAGLSLSSAEVVIQDRGITKKTFWISRSLTWREIRHVRFHKARQDIELDTDGKKLTVDSTFAAMPILLKHIIEYTGLSVVHSD